MNRRTPYLLAAPSRTLSRRAALVGAAQAFTLLIAACTPHSQGETPDPRPSPTPPKPTPAPVARPGPACPSALPAIVPPTPIPYPGYVQVEPSTGLHVTAPPEIIDPAAYRLAVNGRVATELSLSYDDLRCLPKTAAQVIIECPGYFIDRSNLAGATLASVLALAGPLEGAQDVLLVGADRRTARIPLVEATGPDYFLAYEWEGEALPRSHGFPVRAALPGRLGGDWVKWVQEISVA